METEREKLKRVFGETPSYPDVVAVLDLFETKKVGELVGFPELAELFGCECNADFAVNRLGAPMAMICANTDLVKPVFKYKGDRAEEFILTSEQFQDVQKNGKLEHNGEIITSPEDEIYVYYASGNSVS